MPEEVVRETTYKWWRWFLAERGILLEIQKEKEAKERLKNRFR